MEIGYFTLLEQEINCVSVNAYNPLVKYLAENAADAHAFIGLPPWQELYGGKYPEK